MKNILFITMLLGVGYSQCNEFNWQEYYPDMAGCYLVEANLFLADLSEANLTDANLQGANLEWADLSEANLTGSKFEAKLAHSEAVYCTYRYPLTSPRTGAPSGGGPPPCHGSPAASRQSAAGSC